MVLDADAFLAIRTLSFLEVIAATAALAGVFVLPEYVARWELNSIDPIIRKGEASGWLAVRGVVRRTPADAMFRALVKAGVDKGEAEAIAWIALDAGRSTATFISADRAARQVARAQQVDAGDVFDLVVRLIEAGAVARDVAREKLLAWEDPGQQLGRPSDLTPFRFDVAFERRRQAKT